MGIFNVPIRQIFWYIDEIFNEEIQAYNNKEACLIRLRDTYVNSEGNINQDGNQ